MKCIYLLLVGHLSQINLFPTTDLSNAGRREDVRARGLPLLRTAVEGKALTLFESDYCRKFYKYAFSGLERVDSSDTNSFIPDGEEFTLNIENLAITRRRYPPSQPFDERVYGLVSPLPRRNLLLVNRHSLYADHKLALRLKGYCFWHYERLRYSDLRLSFEIFQRSVFHPRDPTPFRERNIPLFLRDLHEH